MPTTPILGITQVSPSQSSKEATINDAIQALEDATNATLSVSYAAVSNYTLTGNEATRNMIFKATGATGACELRFPITVNSNPTNRLFVAVNESGHALTVKFASGAGSVVVIPNGEARLIAASGGLNMIVAAEAPSVVSFLSLTDVPAAYTGSGGKFLAVNLAENAIEFIDAAVFPAFAGNAGKYLIVNATEDGVEWSSAAVVADFLDLADTPSTYTGAAGKLVAVKGTEDGVEFIDPPPAEAVEFPSAEEWRVRVITPGGESQVGFGEIEFRNASGVDLVGSGTASANTFEVGKEAGLAFDNDLTIGVGWLSEDGFVGQPTISYDFGTAVVVRSVKLWPINGAPTFTPSRFVVERYNGASWVEAGDFTAATWVDGVPQTFNVIGEPLSSVADAPADGIPYARRNNDWEDVREWIRDTIATALVEGYGVDVAVNDAGDTITLKTSLPYWVPFGFGAAPLSGEVLLVHVFGEPVEFADNFSGSVDYVGVNPTASFEMLVAKNGTPFGTITIATDGTVTFNTGDGAESFVVGDVMTISAPATVDATLANSAFTLKATRTS